MGFEVRYLVVLAEARSCLAALADMALDVRTSTYFDGLLVALDLATGDVGPATYQISARPLELLMRLRATLVLLDRFDQGGQGLAVESLLAVRNAVDELYALALQELGSIPLVVRVAPPECGLDELPSSFY